MSSITNDGSEPTPGWERETPRYRVAFAVHPSQNDRFKTEPPFAQIMDPAEWQYADRAYRAGETVETRLWPHSSWTPLNYTAEMILQYFNGAMKSRLPRSPFGPDGRVRLETGLTGTNQPKFPIKTGATAA
jgi:hypothetical protein